MNEPFISFPSQAARRSGARTRNGVVNRSKPDRIVFTVQIVATKSPVLFWVKWTDNRGRHINGKVMNAMQVFRWLSGVLTNLVFHDK